MPRVKGGTVTRRRRKKVLKLALLQELSAQTGLENPPLLKDYLELSTTKAKLYWMVSP